MVIGENVKSDGVEGRLASDLDWGEFDGKTASE